MFRLRCPILCLATFVVTGSTLVTQELDERLSMLQPFVGLRCIGMLDDIEVSMHMEAILGGKALRRTSMATALDYSDETIIYWDIEEQQVAFFEVTSRGHTTRGVVSERSGAVVLQGQMVTPQGLTEFRNSFQLMSGGIVKDEWYSLEDDGWELGHSVECVQQR